LSEAEQQALDAKILAAQNVFRFMNEMRMVSLIDGFVNILTYFLFLAKKESVAEQLP
jgi:hypothetical protein